MAVYKCSVCGYVFTEEDGKTYEDLTECPLCGQPKEKLKKEDE